MPKNYNRHFFQTMAPSSSLMMITRSCLRRRSVLSQPSQRRTTSNTSPASSSSSSAVPKKSPTPPTSTPPPLPITPTSFLIGSVAGVCGSLAGMGGGFLMIPLMTSKRLLGLTQHQAHGTSLFAVTTTGLAGAWSYSQSNNNGSSNNVDYEAAAAIAACGMLTARIGAHATAYVSGTMLRKALGVFMLAIAPLVPAKEYLLGLAADDDDDDNNNNKNENDAAAGMESKKNENDLSRFLVPGAIGCCSGFLAGVFGVGGGAVVVPALSLTTDMNHYQALGTSLCAMVPTAIVGTLTHYQKGNVIMKVAPALALGAFTGAFLGGKIGLSLPEQQLKYGFSGVMVVLGLQSLLM